VRYISLLGRIFFALIFVMGGAADFSKSGMEHAEAAGVPMASIAVPLAGVLAIVGGLSIALGYKARLGAWLIVLFLVPVTFYMHAFWKETDPQMMQMQQVNFFKNIALLGAALMITQFGSGPASLKN
jgi:putative oxidoreductase